MLISIQNFSDWLDKRWPYPTQVSQIAVGCGAGAFTELVNKDCAPTALVGIDPSQDQIAYAKKNAWPYCRMPRRRRNGFAF